MSYGSDKFGTERKLNSLERIIKKTKIKTKMLHNMYIIAKKYTVKKYNKGVNYISDKIWRYE